MCHNIPKFSSGKGGLMLNRNNVNKTYGNLVNGEWITSESQQTITINSPVDDSFVGNIQAMTKNEIEDVISNSKEAQKVKC